MAQARAVLRRVGGWGLSGDRTKIIWDQVTRKVDTRGCYGMLRDVMVTNTVTMGIRPEWWIYHQYMAIQTGKIMIRQWMERAFFCLSRVVFHGTLW